MRPDPNRLAYEQRVNRVIDHVRDHLAEDLPLERLARIALFSPFHFHRVFRAITGEPLAAFVTRQRLERAAVALIHHPDQSVLAAALDHGFASAAGFARAFRSHYGMSATQWRAGGARRWSKRRNPMRKPSTATARDALYRSWLLASGYEPDDRPCLELYRDTPQVGGRPGTFRADLCVPVRPI